PRFALAALAADLREAAGRLDAFTGPDPATDVRAVFSWSYRALSPEAARMFRLLGTHPGPDLTAAAAASLAGTDAAQAQRLLGELAHASLVFEAARGRFALHDLLRAYAAGLAEADGEREAAVLRTLDHYLHTAAAGLRLINPVRDRVATAPARPGTAPEALEDGRAAMAWFAAEHAVILAAVEHAAASGHDARCWQLAWTASDYLHRSGHWHDLEACWERVYAVVEPLGDHEALSRVQHRLAFAHALLDHFDEADELLDRALERCRRPGYEIQEGHVHQLRGYMWRRQGRGDTALECNRRALDLYRSAGHLGGQAIALGSIGWHRATVDEAYEEALSDCEAALRLAEAAGDRAGQGAIRDSLGCIHRRLGRHEEAVAQHQRAVDLNHEVGHRFGEAAALANLGETLLETGDRRGAREAWTRAIAVLEGIGHPDVEGLRARLAEIGD
ncbi:tetratricopeptide repeat protein, partial [Glycomyces dulcitolivorans]|uniref:tetratricopeptide repeat protein n=1 Tax=Glycomyces dulcitolivorans TaxID=2200759 RepID=UPI0013006D4A